MATSETRCATATWGKPRRGCPARGRLGWLVLVVALLGPASTALAAPPNDDFANALVLRGTPDRDGDIYDGDLGTTVGATKEAGEPNHAGNGGGASLWYSWTPNRNGAVEIETCDVDTKFDTLLAVYTKSGPVPPFSNLTPVASNNNWNNSECDPPDSRVKFDASAGTTYYIALDGSGGATGPFFLFLWAPRWWADGDGGGTPPSGKYAGRTSQGKPIHFRVSGNGKRIKGLELRERIKCRINGRSRTISGTERQGRGDVLKLRKGKFAKTFRGKKNGVRFRFKIAGRLGDHGFRGEARDRASAPGVSCDTGKIRWRAHAK